MVLASALGVLAVWIFGYLVKRFQTELFMIFSVMVLAIFLVTTLVFSSVLVGNIVNQVQNQLTTDARVFNLTLESKLQEVAAVSDVLSADKSISTLYKDKKKLELTAYISSRLLSERLTSLLVVNSEGIVRQTRKIQMVITIQFQTTRSLNLLLKTLKAKAPLPLKNRA